MEYFAKNLNSDIHWINDWIETKQNSDFNQGDLSELNECILNEQEILIYYTNWGDVREENYQILFSEVFNV